MTTVVSDGPVFGGIELAVHTRIQAAVHAGIEIERILSLEGISPPVWEHASRIWQDALAGSPERDQLLLEKWDAAHAQAGKQFDPEPAR